MFQLFVEGRGENKAGQKLVHKIIHHYQLGEYFFSEGRRIPNIHTNDGLRTAVQFATLDPRTEGVLILRDDEDNCPKEKAPKIADFLRSLKMPFPIAYCILYREFETIFVAYAKELAGKKIQHVVKGTLQFSDEIPEVNPEDIRGAKEWITRCLLNGRAYKPTIDQLTLTQAIDVEKMLKIDLPSFGTLTRCVIHLIKNRNTGLVYPD